MSNYESIGMVSEHEPRDRAGSGPIGYEPTTEEEKSIKLVNRLFEKSKNARKSYDSKWLDNYRFFRGHQWREARPAFRHSEVINFVFRTIQSEVPIITDVLPKPQFIPTEPNDFALASILNSLIDSEWTSNNWLYNFTEILYDAHFYGTSFGCVKFNPEINEGTGGVEFKSSDPFYHYPYKYAKNVNEDSPYYIYAEPRPLDELKKKYPDVEQYLKADVIDFGKDDKEKTDMIRFKSPTDNRTVMEGSSPSGSDKENEAIEITMYIMDEEVVEEEVKELDPETNEEKTLYVKKLKYPKGREIVVVNGVLCKDGPMEYDDKKYPYCRLTNYILPREFWGMSEIEQLEGPQRIFNKLISFALDVLTLMGNPIWVVDTTSGVDTDNLFNRPGLVVEKEPGTQVTREEGVQLQPYVLQLIDRMKMWFDDVAGNPDASRGINPTGVTAASAIEALQSSANVRMRQKSKNVDAFMQDFGQMYLSRVFQYYTVPRVYRITGRDDSINYFKFHVEHQVNPETGEEVRLARMQPYTIGDDQQYYLGDEQQFEIRRKFDVKVSTGSALPFEKSRIEQQSFNLYDRGIIDAEEVLTNLNYPNKEAVMKRQAEKQMQMAQAQQAQSGQTPGQAPMMPQA